MEGPAADRDAAGIVLGTEDGRGAEVRVVGCAKSIETDARVATIAVSEKYLCGCISSSIN